MARRGPTGGTLDEQAAKELYIYAMNDGTLYRRQREPIEQNLRRKITKGNYDFKKAITAWKNFADTAAKAYTREHGSGSGFGIFTPETRRHAAKEMAITFHVEEFGKRPSGA